MFSSLKVLFVFLATCLGAGLWGYGVGLVCMEAKIRNGEVDEAWLLRALEMCRWRKSMPGKDKPNA